MHRKYLNQYFKTDGWYTPSVGEKSVDKLYDTMYNEDKGTTNDINDTWKKSNEKELRYAGDSARESVDKGLKETSKFMKDAPEGTNYSDVQSASVKWSLANDANNNELKQSAFDELTGHLSAENKDAYLKKARPLQEFVDAKDTFDYNHNNYTTTKNSTQRFDQAIQNMQRKLNEKGYTDKFGEKLKEDGIYGGKTRFAEDSYVNSIHHITDKDNSTPKIQNLFLSADAPKPKLEKAIGNPEDIKNTQPILFASRGGTRGKSSEDKNDSSTSNYFYLREIIEIKNLSDTIKIAESFADKTSTKNSWGFVNSLYPTGYGIDKKSTKTQFKNFVKQIANALFLPVDFALAVVEQESSYDHWRGGEVNENDGDYGLMQINKNSHPDAFNSKVLDVVNNWQHNVIYGLTYLKYCFDEAVRLGYRNNELLKAAYSNYNSGSCKAYKIPNHDAYGNVNIFWGTYKARNWENRK